MAGKTSLLRRAKAHAYKFRHVSFSEQTQRFIMRQCWNVLSFKEVSRTMSAWALNYAGWNQITAGGKPESGSLLKFATWGFLLKVNVLWFATWAAAEYRTAFPSWHPVSAWSTAPDGDIFLLRKTHHSLETSLLFHRFTQLIFLNRKSLLVLINPLPLCNPSVLGSTTWHFT